MEITFGIITTNNERMMFQIIQSIIAQNIPTMEIIVVGDYVPPIVLRQHVRVIRFDETVRKNWITRKKNIICNQAKYDTIVLMHDYIKLDPGWYEGMLKYKGPLDFCVTKIKTQDGQRYRDFVLFQADVLKNTLLPYDYDPTPVRKLMYISGAFYIIKKSIAHRFPLDERLLHCQGEDVDLSQRLVLNGIYPSFNPYSCVSLLKHKDIISMPISHEELKGIEQNADAIFEAQRDHLRIYTSTIVQDGK